MASMMEAKKFDPMVYQMEHRKERLFSINRNTVRKEKVM